MPRDTFYQQFMSGNPDEITILGTLVIFILLLFAVMNIFWER